MYIITELFDLAHTQAKDYLASYRYPWEALQGLKEFIVKQGELLSRAEYEEISLNVWVHKTAKIAPTAYLGAPCIVGADTEIRHCAFIRGSALIGKGCVVGNSTELKNVILFDGVQVPHYNYVGDSILGYKAHLGAGAITSNVKSDKTPIAVKGARERAETGLKKFGAAVGDYVEVGCNSVLNPGTVIGRRSVVYPLSCVRGVVEEDGIYKTGGVIVKKNADKR
ncbi:MAG: UDP-N-acetylglucosamine pyrophosphorylase [Clostridia bacterium]|nr:UDP-N-acetylglucosamine pyrophosphorylase [Clostridia bacterium]